MKEIKLSIGSVWSLVTTIVVAAMLCGTAIFITLQVTHSQETTAKAQADAMKEAGKSIGSGICRASDRTFLVCGE